MSLLFARQPSKGLEERGATDSSGRRTRHHHHGRSHRRGGGRISPPLSRADREHKPEPGVPPAQNRAVSLAPMPCSGGALSFALSRRVALIDSFFHQPENGAAGHEKETIRERSHHRDHKHRGRRRYGGQCHYQRARNCSRMSFSIWPDMCARRPISSPASRTEPALSFRPNRSDRDDAPPPSVAIYGYQSRRTPKP